MQTAATGMIRWQSATKNSGLFFRTTQCFTAGAVLELRFFAQVISGSPSVPADLRARDATTNYPTECASPMRVAFGSVGSWTEVVLNLTALCPLPLTGHLAGFQLVNTGTEEKRKRKRKREKKKRKESFLAFNSIYVRLLFL